MEFSLSALYRELRVEGPSGFVEASSYGEALVKALEVKTGESYRGLPIHVEEVEVDRDFFARYEGKQGLFVVGAVENSEGKLLWVRNRGRAMGWELVGGKMDSYRPAEDLAREVWEETRVKVLSPRPLGLLINVFHLNPYQRLVNIGVAFHAYGEGEPKPLEAELWEAVFRDTPEEIAFGNRKVLEWVGG